MASADTIAAKIQKAAENLDDEVEDAIDSSTEEMEHDAATTLRRNGNFAHEVLIRSLRTTTPRAWSSKYDVVKSVRASAGHAPYIEYGTGTFNTGDDPFTRYKSPDPRPPVGKIRQWIIRKGIIPRSMEMRSENLVADQEKLAWAIADSIGTYGNRSYPFMRPSYRRHKAETVGRVADGISDAFDV